MQTLLENELMEINAGSLQPGYDIGGPTTPTPPPVSSGGGGGGNYGFEMIP